MSSNLAEVSIPLFSLMFLAAAQQCLRPADSGTNLPEFRDGNDRLRNGNGAQVIVTSYQFQCCGDITAWMAHVRPNSLRFDGTYNINFQVWRPSQTVASDGAGNYSLVGENPFTSINFAANRLISETPSPSNVISVRPGDVVGYNQYNMEERDDAGIEIGEDYSNTRLMWYRVSATPVIENGRTIHIANSLGTLSSFTNAGPIISLSITAYPCLSTTTTLAIIPQPTTTVAVVPQPTTSVAVVPQPTTSVAVKPQPTTSIAVEPQPTTTVAVEPQPTTTVAVVPQLTTTLAVSPQPTTLFEPQPSAVELQPSTTMAILTQSTSTMVLLAPETTDLATSIFTQSFTAATDSNTDNASPASSGLPFTEVVAGGVAGGVVILTVITMLALSILFCFRRSRNNKAGKSRQHEDSNAVIATSIQMHSTDDMPIKSNECYGTTLAETRGQARGQDTYYSTVPQVDNLYDEPSDVKATNFTMSTNTSYGTVQASAIETSMNASYGKFTKDQDTCDGNGGTAAPVVAGVKEKYDLMSEDDDYI